MDYPPRRFLSTPAVPLALDHIVGTTRLHIEKQLQGICHHGDYAIGLLTLRGHLASNGYQWLGEKRTTGGHVLISPTDTSFAMMRNIIILCR